MSDKKEKKKPVTEKVAEKSVKKVKKLKKDKPKTAPGHIIIRKSDDRRAHWYVVHTYSGHEVKVSQQMKQRVVAMDLTDHILEILIPTQEKIEIRQRQKKKIREKIFPGYLMVRMILSDQSWLAVRTTPGVTGFVGIGTQPTSLPPTEVEAILKFIRTEAPKFKAKFTEGEAVKIVDGPFADFLGTVETIDKEKGKVRVLISIFGRETPVELDFLQVAKL